MNVTVSTEQESCSSRTEESRVRIEHRQGNERECGMNDSDVPVLCNVGTSDHNLSHPHECVSRGSEQCYGLFVMYKISRWMHFHCSECNDGHYTDCLKYYI
jgi:hypothetical protein